MFRVKTKLGLLLLRPRVALLLFNDFMNQYFLFRKKSIKAQEESLQSSLKFAADNIPYYKKLFESMGKTPEQLLGCFNEIPVLKKDTIKENPSLFHSPKKIRFNNVSTGGSTGEPLRFLISKKSSDYAFYSLLRGFSRGGYKVGDKLATLAGGSLVTKSVLSPKEKLIHSVFNFKKFSTFGLSERDLTMILSTLNNWQPDILRGYASSIFIFSEHIKKNNLQHTFQLKSIFTTAEQLTTTQRKVIEEVFNCKVFDSYGLNDGGITAFECTQHEGFHIDTDRAYLEVVDENGQPIYDKLGRILATTLVEEKMPFIRYETGDLGVLSKGGSCKCGDAGPILTSLQGRTTDYLDINEKKVGSPVLTVLMGKVNCQQYQIIQKSSNEILLKVRVENRQAFLTNDAPYIQDTFDNMVGDVSIYYDFDSDFTITRNGKHKFIIREE